MEFPHVGDQCSEKTCNQLDFLPMRCDGCKLVFCKDHIHYKTHHCPSPVAKDVQVPVCPLCNSPVPSKRGEAPDIAVGDHIDRDCQSDPAKAKRQIYTNQCSVAKCKKRELVPIQCSSCRRNYCLKHRHAVDHDCKGFENTGRAAAASRLGARSSSNTVASGKADSRRMPQPKSEDEALSLAIQLSLQDNEKPSNAAASSTDFERLSQEEADQALARALAESEREYHNQQSAQRKDSSKCVIS